MAITPQPEPSATVRGLSDRPAFVLAVASVIAVAAWLEQPNIRASVGQDRVRFVDPDDYTRVFRARLISESDAARLRHLTQINHPAGVESHWTSPMDYLLASAFHLTGVSLGKSPVEALARAAAWTPAILGLLYLSCMMTFMRRGFGTAPAVLAGLVAALSPAFHRVFQVGHPDHHCLLELLLLIAIGAWLPYRRPDGSPGLPSRAGGIVGGCAIGLAVWVAAQAVFFWAALAVGLTWACLYGPVAERRAYAAARCAWGCAAGGLLLAGFLIENWPDLNTVAIDKISLFHLALAALTFLAPARLEPAGAVSSREPGSIDPDARIRSGNPQRNRVRRSPALFLAACATFGVWLTWDRSRVFEYVSSPEFHRWSAQIAELLPLYTRTTSDWSLTPMHALTGWLPYALLPLVVLFALSQRVPRAFKVTLVLLAPAVMILTVEQRRWLDHLNLAVTPVVVIGLWELAGRVRFRSGSLLARWHGSSIGVEAGSRPVPPADRRFVATAVLLGLLIHPSARVLISFTPSQAISNLTYQRRTEFAAQEIIDHHAAHPRPTTSQPAILSDEGEGPILLYHTGLPVVAAPYHRALLGILETARFFAERDPAAARAQLDRLGVRYIVVPRRPHEQLAHFEKLVFDELRSFDPPTQSIDESGRIRQQLHYRPDFTKTMAYRLAMMPDQETIPGVRCLRTIDEGAKTAAGLPFETGLLYVVDELAINDAK